MIIKNNKKCNIKINNKNIETYTKEDILTMLELNLKGFYDENDK